MKITRNPASDTILRAEDDAICVEFITLGEGYNGDYDPEDPCDAELIRFDVYANGLYTEGEWDMVDDASYCTSLEVGTPINILEKKIKIVFDEYRNVYDNILNGESVKKLGETLSWI